MIGYGVAFAIGYVAFLVARVMRNREVYPWSLGGIIWGGVFMGLNWVASL